MGGLEAAAAAAATIAVGLELFGVLSRVAGLNADARAMRMRGALYRIPCRARGRARPPPLTAPKNDKVDMSLPLRWLCMGKAGAVCF